jgi:hypothetical protein
MLEFPVFGRVVHALLQAPALFFKADVQHELQDHGAGFAEHPLEVVDVGKALTGLGRRDPASNHRDQHIFVVAAVEQHHVARARHLLVDAPQVVMGQLGLVGRLPADGVHTQGAHASEYVADGAVFPRCIGALQNHQQLVAAVRPEQILQGIQFMGKLIHGDSVGRLVPFREWLGTWIDVGKGEGLPVTLDRGLPGVQQAFAGAGGMRHGRSLVDVYVNVNINRTSLACH